ncbi:MAG: B12-binding domain-containing radical SAM protein [Eubacterium sp.]|nr:B12-binding domain-containing radical SAM protein [Eubacterium sp.]
MRYILSGINAKYIHSNLAIFCLKSYAEAYGLPEAEYVIKEYTINNYVEDILTDLYEARGDVLIFSCYIWNISYVRELAGEMKKIRPDMPVWVGGPEVSYDAEEFLKTNPAVDLVMQGEGEEQFTELVRLWEDYNTKIAALSDRMEETSRSEPSTALLNRLSKAPLPRGVALRTSDGIINTGFADLVDMDRIPFVYEDFRLFEHKIIYYESSRGCPFRCSYCLSSVDKTVRFRSLDLVLPELQRFLDARVAQVKFVDRTFNCRVSHAMTIWQYIHEHDNGVTNFHFEISSDLLTEEAMTLFEKMRPGLIQLEIGVQSTNEPTIDAINRHMDLSRLFANVDRVHALGNIHQHLDLIAGLPYESYDQFKRSFNDIYLHEPDQLQLGFLKVLKGTQMEMDQDKHGIAYRSLPPYEVLKTAWMDYDELIRLKGVEEMVETYYNSMQYTWTLKYVVPFFESPFDFYESFSIWYRGHGYHKMNHSRMARYELLRDYLRETDKYNNGVQLTVEAGRIIQSFYGESAIISQDLLDEMLLLDMYLREGVKSRPSWAPDQTPYKNTFKQMYREQGEELFPALWSQGRYESKKAANHSHMEWFSFDVGLWIKENKIVRRSCLCLFDYSDRNPLNYNAAIREISS